MSRDSMIKAVEKSSGNAISKVSKNLDKITDEKEKEFRKLQRLVPRKKRSSNENPENPVVKCEGTAVKKCSRITQADMFIDISDLPKEVRGESIYVCDACIDRLKRMELI